MRRNAIITNELITIVCDKLCKYPNMSLAPEDMDKVCEACPLNAIRCELANKDVAEEELKLKIKDRINYLSSRVTSANAKFYEAKTAELALVSEWLEKMEVPDEKRLKI